MHWRNAKANDFEMEQTHAHAHSGPQSVSSAQQLKQGGFLPQFAACGEETSETD